MNKRPPSGRDYRAVNGGKWVFAAVKLAAGVDQTRPFTSPPVNVRYERKLPIVPVKAALPQLPIQGVQVANRRPPVAAAHSPIANADQGLTAARSVQLQPEACHGREGLAV
jgi:hypothetical protein